jgi:hypothetical protein
MSWRSAIGWLAAVVLVFIGYQVAYQGGSHLGQLAGGVYWLWFGAIAVGFLVCIIFAVWIADRFAMM